MLPNKRSSPAIRCELILIFISTDDDQCGQQQLNEQWQWQFKTENAPRYRSRRYCQSMSSIFISDEE